MHERNIEQDLLNELEAEITQAMNHQLRLTKEAEILTAKCEIAGQYRVRLMDLRDKFRDKLKAAEQE
jgi:hypothetical protein